MELLKQSDLDPGTVSEMQKDADRLEKMGTSRLWATIIILFGFLILFILFLMVLVPVLANQIAGFLDRLPELVGKLQSLIASTESEWIRNLIGGEGSSIQDNLNSIMKEGAGWIATVLSNTAFVAPAFTATANPCIISSTPLPMQWMPSARLAKTLARWAACRLA